MRYKCISFNKYKIIDISLLTLIAIIFEIISVKSLSWFEQVFYISTFFIISLITMIRWNYLAIFPIVANAITYCIVAGGRFESYIIYIFGNLFLLINLIWFIKGKNILKNTYALICYIFSGYILVSVGKTLVSMFFDLGEDINTWDVLLGNFEAHTLTIFVTIIILVVLNNQGTIMIDQKEYVESLKEENYDSSLEV